MIGRKTLGEVRAETEAALGAKPAVEGRVAGSLRRFLASGTAASAAPPEFRDAGVATVTNFDWLPSRG